VVVVRTKAMSMQVLKRAGVLLVEKEELAMKWQQKL